MIKFAYKALLFIVLSSSMLFGMNEKFKEDNTSSSSSTTSRKKNTTTLKAATPTHVAFMSTSDVLDYGELVVSTREISGGLGADFMLFASPWNGLVGSGEGAHWGNAISDTRIGAKFSMSSSMMVGAGLNMEGSQTGLAGFFSTKIKDNGASTIYVSPSAVYKINNDGWHSIGINFGGFIEKTELFDFFWEVGFAHQISIYDPDGDEGDAGDVVDGYGLISGTGGIRITVPSAPFIYFDIGLAAKEYLYRAHDDQGGDFLGAYLNLGTAFSL